MNCAATKGVQYPAPMTSLPRGGNLLSYFWTPIVAVGCSGPEGPNAQISVSVFGASVVPDRPRLLATLYKRNYTHDLVAAKGDFSLSLLDETQVDLIPKLGFVSGREGDKLEGLDYTLTERGNPVLVGSIGWLECSVIESFDLGDCTAFLGAVMENRRLTDGVPLVWATLAPTLPQAWRDEWAAKMEGDIGHYRMLMHWL
jgi:flavin reductase (DIM6/NTAB) family NADH-FMN oxidoreductase RutF